jgi:hypothetical protein
MSQSLILIDVLSSVVGREKEKKREKLGFFFPSAGHTLLAVPHGIFRAVTCN